MDTDHDLNLYLGLHSWIQIMILNLALQALFVDPFLSLIIHFGTTSNPFFPTLDSHFSQVRISTLLFLFLSCCISSLGKRAYCNPSTSKFKTPCTNHSKKSTNTWSKLGLTVGNIDEQQSWHGWVDAMLFWMSNETAHKQGSSSSGLNILPSQTSSRTKARHNDKLDITAAYRKCHLIDLTALQMCTQLPSEGLALVMLWLTFGDAPCQLEWGSIAESICSLANTGLLSGDWDPLSFHWPAQHLVPKNIVMNATKSYLEWEETS